MCQHGSGAVSPGSETGGKDCAVWEMETMKERCQLKVLQGKSRESSGVTDKWNNFVVPIYSEILHDMTDVNYDTCSLQAVTSTCGFVFEAESPCLIDRKGVYVLVFCLCSFPTDTENGIKLARTSINGSVLHNCTGNWYLGIQKVQRRGEEMHWQP